MDIRPIGNIIQPAAAYGDRSIAVSESTASAKTVSTPVETVTAIQQPASIPTMAQVTQAVKSINKAMQKMAQGLEFTVDSDSHRTIIKVVDQETKEVIRQIPTEETLEIAKALDQVQGLLIKQKA